VANAELHGCYKAGNIMQVLLAGDDSKFERQPEILDEEDGWR